MDVFNELWRAAQQAGPFSTLILLVLWWFERDERKSNQAKLDGLIERVLIGLGSTTAAISDLRAFFVHLSGRHEK